MANNTINKLLARAIREHDKITVGQLWRAKGLLTVKQYLAILSVFAFLFAAGFNAGRWWSEWRRPSTSSAPLEAAASDEETYVTTLGESEPIPNISLRDEPPEEPPPISLLTDLPSREVVNAELRKAWPTSHELFYKNDTGKKLRLFVLDCSKYYSDESGYWYAFPLAPWSEFQKWDRFAAGNSGWFGFVVRDIGTGKDTSLGCKPLFNQQQTRIAIAESDGRLALRFE